MLEITLKRGEFRILNEGSKLRGIIGTGPNNRWRKYRTCDQLNSVEFFKINIFNGNMVYLQHSDTKLRKTRNNYSKSQEHFEAIYGKRLQ